MRGVSRIQSSSLLAKPWVTGGFAFFVGGLMLYLNGHREVPNKAAQLLGIGLFMLGVVVLAYSQRIVLEIDREKRELRVVKDSRFGTKVEVIPFERISGTEITAVGNRYKSGFRTYFLKVLLRDGRVVKTGFLSHSRDEVELAGLEIEGATKLLS